jgi:F-type H+-transporting ATPase subunit g
MNFVAKAPGMLLRVAQPRLATFGKYAKVELTPPMSGAEMGGVVKGAAGLVKDALTFRWASATVGEATVNAIIVAEIACWFFIGECIGKGSLVGYQV